MRPINPPNAATNVPRDFTPVDTKTPIATPEFTRGPARRPQPPQSGALLQWATGLQTKERTLYAGWFIEVGKDENLDAAMESAGFGTVTIKHGGGNMVTHRALPTAHLFIACSGVQSIGEMKRTEERYGIAFGWGRTEDGRAQSVLRLRAYIQELLVIGYCEPITLSVKSTLTGDLITALTLHYDTLDAINPIRAALNKPPIDAPYYAVAVALTAGQEVARGSGGQTKAITPPVCASLPTKEYIVKHWCRREWAEVIEAGLDETIAWSITESERIAAGDGAQEGDES